MTRWLVTTLAALAATGCGSLATWHYSDATVAGFLAARGTHCEALPRAYSGAWFDYCWLDSEPQPVYGSAPLLLLLGDGLLSVIADTLALPVTLVQQREQGSIPLRPARPAVPAAFPATGTGSAPDDNLLPATPR